MALRPNEWYNKNNESGRTSGVWVKRKGETHSGGKDNEFEFEFWKQIQVS